MSLLEADIALSSFRASDAAALWSRRLTLLPLLAAVEQGQSRSTCNACAQVASAVLTHIVDDLDFVGTVIHDTGFNSYQNL